MAPLRVSIAHELGRAEAKRRIADGLAHAGKKLEAASISVRQHWTVDTLDFEATALAQMVRGRVVVTDRSVDLELDLPALLSIFADKVTRQIKDRGIKLLAKG